MSGSPSRGVVGFRVFASIMMLIIGLMHMAFGLTAIIEDKFFVVTPNYVFSSTSRSGGGSI